MFPNRITFAHFTCSDNDLLVIVMVQNYGAFLERDGAGFRGKIELTGFKDGDIDLSKSTWTYQVYLKFGGILVSSSFFLQISK